MYLDLRCRKVRAILYNLVRPSFGKYRVFFKFLFINNVLPLFSYEISMDGVFVIKLGSIQRI